MKIGFIGLGKLGLPVALAIESKGHEVIGYDNNPKVIDAILKRKMNYDEAGAQELLNKSKIKTGDLKYLVNSDIIFIAVQTPHEKEYEGVTKVPYDRRDFDYSFLITACNELKKEIDKQKAKPLVVIISTCLPGTIEREIMPILKVVYNPFFIAMGTTISDFLNPEFVLIGGGDKKLDRFYKSIHNKPIYNCTIKEAEMIKVSYNTFISTKISLANSIGEMCYKLGINSDKVMDALFMATDRIISTKYLKAGMGDGGGCHPRDCIAMSYLAREMNLSYDWYNNLIRQRENHTAWLANLCLVVSQQNSLPLIILGKAFKKGTNITTGSPALLLTSYLRCEFEHLEFEPVNKKAVYFIATNHDEYLSYKFPRGSVVIDPWRYIKPQKGVKLISI